MSVIDDVTLEPSTPLLPQAGRPKRARRERVLLLCYFDIHGISTAYENISYLQRYSRYSIEVWNLYGRPIPFRLPANFDLAECDAIVFHNTISYTIDNISTIDVGLALRLGEYSGVKILFKQDEQFRTDRVAKFIGEKGIDVVFTCLSPAERGKVYSRDVTGPTKYQQMLTGYVTPAMRNYHFSQNDERPIDVGYRGSLQPLYFGRLAYEKYEIGVKFAEVANRYDLVTDISSDASARLSGYAWIEFLARSKGTLGTESGASVFDMSSSLEQQYERLVEEFGGYLRRENWAKRWLNALRPLEGVVDYAQVSPRHFEAAATRTVQILYEGRYSGIFVPGRHYLPLKKDFSNVDEIIASLLDKQKRLDLTEAAFEEVVLNRNFWIERFAAEFDQQLEESLMRKGIKRCSEHRSAAAKKHIVLMCAHVPRKDPRIGWISSYAPEHVKVHVLGVHDEQNVADRVTYTDSGALEVQVYRRTYREQPLMPWTMEGFGSERKEFGKGVLAMSALSAVKSVAAGRTLALLTPALDKRQAEVQWYMNHFLDTTTALVRGACAFSEIDGVIAADLDTLAAGVLIKEHFGIPLLYDAHEYWADSDPNRCQWEANFWRQLESLLLAETDARFTVSAPMARYLEDTYRIPFECVANAEPMTRMLVSIERRKHGDGVVFLFQGGYAKGRGLELLISNWVNTPERAILHLRGPRWEFVEHLEALADRIGLLGKRIFFLDAVRESELVSAAAEADVGVIPYEPDGKNNTYCCPNKLSQYMAAGLPLFANTTEYVRELVTANQLGVVVDYTDSDAFVAGVRQLVEENTTRKRFAHNARRFFTEQFHWENVSGPMYGAMERLVGGGTGDLEEKITSYFSGLPGNTVTAAVRAGTLRTSARTADSGCGVRRSVLPRDGWSRVARGLWGYLPEAMRERVLGTVLTYRVQLLASPARRTKAFYVVRWMWRRLPLKWRTRLNEYCERLGL